MIDLLVSSARISPKNLVFPKNILVFGKTKFCFVENQMLTRTKPSKMAQNGG